MQVQRNGMMLVLQPKIGSDGEMEQPDQLAVHLERKNQSICWEELDTGELLKQCNCLPWQLQLEPQHYATGERKTSSEQWKDFFP